ncbi:MAG: homogentisate 1,2-dioxygenase [bacterium]|nr:homogentisate 1,2-dioxygenase [bacterium]
MIHRHTLGKLPPKPHTAFYDEDGALLMEQCVTREGFDGPFSILYFRGQPTDETGVEAMTLPGFCPVEVAPDLPLARRHIRTQDVKPGGDFLTGRRTMLVNSDVRVGSVKTDRPARDFFSNADGDEVWFAYDGPGTLESLYGRLEYRQHDYVYIPKATPYRIHPRGDRGTFLVFEATGFVDVPKQFRNSAGQLTLDAPFSHRDFRVPTELMGYNADRHGSAPYRLVIKKSDRLGVHTFDHWPLDVVGWDGYSYPVAFNIHDYQPKTGLIHLPPTYHITFAGNGFIICSFVPREVDYHEKAIPCPYGHAAVDCDEILYYVDGNFISRKGIEPQSISLHPAGVAHGPHPGAYKGSIGVKRTEELAVMCDTFKPLQMTKAALDYDDPDYHRSWVK